MAKRQNKTKKRFSLFDSCIILSIANFQNVVFTHCCFIMFISHNIYHELETRLRVYFLQPTSEENEEKYLRWNGLEYLWAQNGRAETFCFISTFFMQ